MTRNKCILHVKKVLVLMSYTNQSLSDKVTKSSYKELIHIFIGQYLPKHQLIIDDKKYEIKISNIAFDMIEI